jgi:hypothetical protein
MVCFEPNSQAPVLPHQPKQIGYSMQEILEQNIFPF